jgi:murein DD-endopeptidase MepM/ murein hydrolase activator NlpD
MSNLRTTVVPEGYKPNTSSGKYIGSYIGFVKDNSDPLKMGRLKVWIPEINHDPVNGLFTVSYCSPFAGASPANALDGTQSSAQVSYGWWGIPPHVENEVVVQFINGDANRGIWIGCMYQQFMNNMVPGIPTSTLITDPTKQGPALEYNKKDGTQSAKATADTPQRPIFTPLAQGLANQGLQGDDNRGNSSASARRSNVPDVIGLLSPGGSQFVIDDNNDDQYIRLRTAHGTQIIINDTIGFIYLNSRNGNSWMEISDDGIDVYSAKAISMRSQGDFNIHTDGNFNLYAQSGVNISSATSIGIAAASNLDIAAGGHGYMTCGGEVSVNAAGDLTINGSGNLGINSCSILSLKSCGNIGISSSASLLMQATSISSNGGGSVPTPKTAPQATVAQIGSKGDTELSPASGYPALSTKTIVSRLPGHEPYGGHPSSSSIPTQKSVNLNYSTRVEAGDSGVSNNTKSTDVLPGQTASQNSSVTNDGTIQTGNNENWWIPATGRVSSQFGFRPGNVAGAGNNHPGVDIAAPQGTTIIASKAGKVIFSAFGQSGSGYGGYGNCVCIDHGDGTKSIYGHMYQTPSVNKGDTVQQGQRLGGIGSTGSSTGNHCHFEIRNGNTPVNPASFISVLGNKGTNVPAGNPNSGGSQMVAQNSTKPAQVITSSGSNT